LKLPPSTRRLVAELGAAQPIGLWAPLTAVYVIAYLSASVLADMQVPLVQLGLVAVAGTTLLLPYTRSSPWPWGIIVGLMLLVMITSWMTVDNHVFLATYWLIAVTMARAAPAEARDGSLASAACWLVGMTMLFATIHKLRAPNFLSGDFFYMTFITEDRFAPLSLILGEDLAQLSSINADKLAALRGDPSSGPISLVAGTEAVRRLAIVMSWGVAIFEGLLAILWLVRLASPVGHAMRHGSLIGFIFLTYSVAPVPGFGSILSILGLADTRSGDTWLRVGYLAALLHVLFASSLMRGLVS
jgi:hypothetical protein